MTFMTKLQICNVSVANDQPLALFMASDTKRRQAWSAW